jgi:hypothetical protein
VVTDFRLELGSGYEISWLVPTEPNGRLRLILIGYVTVDMDPEIKQDPCAVDFRGEWRGELSQVGGGGVVDEVQLMMTSEPPAYRCAARVRQPDGTHREYLLSFG